MTNLVDALASVGAAVRYVAAYRDGRLDLRKRDGLDAASAAQSDRHEALLVNPTRLTLLVQRGGH